jgi:exonuclease SbcC
MRKIKRIKAWGLWSHLESVFDFSPGLTVITGGNDAGKTSVLKIIRWVALGEPEGESFIFQLRDRDTKEVIQESKFGKAEITYDDGIVITKERKRNGRTIYTHSDYVEPFIQASVPLEISETMGIKTTTFGDLSWDLNFSFQHDAPFLLSEAPTAGAKALGVIAGTEVVDLAISSCKSDRYAAQRKQNEAESALETAAAKLLPYETLDQNLGLAAECRKLMDSIDRGLDTRAKLDVLVTKFAGLSNTITVLSEKERLFVVVPELIDQLALIGLDFSRYDELKRLLALHNTLSDAIASFSSKLVTLNDVNGLDILISCVSVANGQLSDLILISDKKDRLDARLTELFCHVETYKDLDQIDMLLTDTKNDYLVWDELDGLSRAYIRAEDYKNECNEWLDKLSVIGACEALCDTIREDIRKKEHLDLISGQYTRTNNLVLAATHNVEKAEKDLEAANVELQSAWSAAGGVCPLCLKTLDECDHN